MESNILDFKVKQTPLNTGTERGSDVLLHSLKQFGCTKSIVVDKDNNVLCGKSVLKHAIEAGISKTCVVETTGDTLVVVKRTDVSAETRKGYEIAFVDNLCSQEGLNWDIENLKQVMSTHPGFDPRLWTSSISWLEELSINDFFTEIENDKKQVQTTQKNVQLPNRASLFDILDEEEEVTE